MINPELVKIATKYPIDSIITYKGKEIGYVIGYKRANGKDSIEVIFQHFEMLASGKQGMFSTRARHYGIK
jgi:hypothetical protein